MLFTPTKSTLRAFQPEDAQSIARHLASYNVACNLLVPFPYTLQHAETWIAKCIAESSGTRFAIVIDGEAVGGIGVERLGGINPEVLGHTAELGYWLAERYWGRGIISEVVAAVSDYAFAQLGMVRLQAAVFARNPASVRVLSKCGYEYEGRLRARYFRDGQYIDGLLYAKVKLP